MTQPAALSHDPRWPRASEWLTRRSTPMETQVVLVGIPAHRTSLSPTQAHTTPAAIRAALARYSPYAASGETDLLTQLALDVGDMPDPDGDESATISTVAQAVALSRITIGLGGDNSITYAMTHGVARGLDVSLQEVGLVTLDAHHDVRDGVSNGSPVQRLIADGLDPHHIVQVGINDFANSRSYAEQVRDSGMTVISRLDVAEQGIHHALWRAMEIAGAGGRPVMVDLDVDVCDRAVVPACPAAMPGGLSALELRQAARFFGQHQQVRGLDLTEIDASIDTPDERTVRLAALCVLEAAAGAMEREAAV